MILLVASDIFGKTPELSHWLKPIAHTCNATLQLLSPYPESPDASAMLTHSGTTDAMAYQHFLASGGLEAYRQKLQQQLACFAEPVTAIGFSAGAAALWQLAAQPNSGIGRLIAFYGGQIRNFSTLQPLIATTCIWSEEPHFDVAALHHQLKQQPLVSSALTSYQHGFINPYSAGFNQQAAGYYQQWLINHLGALTEG